MIILNHRFNIAMTSARKRGCLHRMFALLIQSALLLVAFIVVLKPAGALANPILAVPAGDSDKIRFEDDIAQRLRNLIQQDVAKYCPDGCTLLGVDAEAREVFDIGSASLGFETTPSTARNFVVRRASAEILVDNRLGKSNIERIQEVLLRSARRYSTPVEIEFTRTTLPDPPHVVRAEAEAKVEAVEMVKSALVRLLNDFCTFDCRLQSVELKTTRIPLEEAQSSMSRRAVVIRDSKYALMVTSVTADLLVDTEMGEDRRLRIENLVQEHLETYGPGTLNVKLATMPKSAQEIQKDADEERQDPWGLEKLGRALKIFREFANTKEIIRERDTLSREKESEKQRERESDREKRSESTSEKNLSSMEMKMSSREMEQSKSMTDNRTTNNTDNFSSFWTQERVLLIAGAIALLLLISALGLRYVLTGKQVQHLISEGRGNLPPVGEFAGENADDLRASADSDFESATPRPAVGMGVNVASLRARLPVYPTLGVNDEVAMRMNIQALREELTQMFVSQPKIARDVFSRVLREDGIEFAAKCVSVLGDILVYDLMGDADVKKEVTLLAEYIHVNAPIVGDGEQLTVLRSLKMKMTAGRLRQMTQRTKDMFDFLKSSSPRQIYDLLMDESARSQAVVLTQLTTEKRRAVFELFEGNLKTALLRELCVKESLPREYLFNVAQALKRKIERLGTADGEMLGGADVIIDLMERGDRDSQDEMMANLDHTNPELARQVRSRLVSVETLAYLSDGLLLEIFLALEPQVMVTFLAGTRDKIRQLILRKAPEEVANDWNDSAETLRGLDAESFRLAEMQVLGKIRSFEASGLIQLSEINEIMYPRPANADKDLGSNKGVRSFRISSPIVA